MIILICSNCEYEVNYLTAEEGLCQTCWRAYERGRESKMSDLEGTKWCVYCEGVADFQWLDGGFYVCTGCIKEGETDTK